MREAVESQSVVSSSSYFLQTLHTASHDQVPVYNMYFKSGSTDASHVFDCDDDDGYDVLWKILRHAGCVHCV